MIYYFKLPTGNYLEKKSCSKRIAYEYLIEDFGYTEHELDEMFTSSSDYRIDQLEKKIEELENKVMQLID